MTRLRTGLPRYAAALWLLWPASVAGAANVAPTQLHFVAYSTGFRVMQVQANLALNGAGYDVAVGLQTTGVLNVFVGGRTLTEARGRWQQDTAVPAYFGTSGHWRGETLLTRMEYVDGTPKIETILPDPRLEREPVAASLQVDTMDSLSAMAELVRRANDGGRCDGTARTFDGRRLSAISVRTVGMETLAPSDRSSFSGPALRCDFDGRLLAGFKFEDDRARAARPRHGTAWLGRLVAGGPLLPVRMRFDTPFFDDVTMYLAP